jgi:hypothetical protein
VTDPAVLPLGNTTAEYMVIDKDGKRSTAGPTTIVVLPPNTTGPVSSPTQPPQTITDPTQNYTLPPAIGVNSTDPYNTSLVIYKNESGVLVPVVPGLKPGDVLTPAQIKNITSDPNNLPLVVVYNVSNEHGSNTSISLLNITAPLSAALPQLPAVISVDADNSSGMDATNYVPKELATYTGMA